MAATTGKAGASKAPGMKSTTTAAAKKVAPKSAPKAKPAKGAATARKLGAASIPPQDSVRDQAASFTQQAKDKMRDAANTGKGKASEAMNDMSSMVDDVAKSIDEKLGTQYGDYARKAASVVSGFADSLQSKEVEDIVKDARDFVKKRPAVAIGAAAAIGFVLTRMIKANSDED
jgi:ElaB/YqjD/DUF883 family membrane-anchored ribosome-binding protein